MTSECDGDPEMERSQELADDFLAQSLFGNNSDVGPVGGPTAASSLGPLPAAPSHSNVLAPSASGLARTFPSVRWKPVATRCKGNKITFSGLEKYLEIWYCVPIPTATFPTVCSPMAATRCSSDE
jgi:hypothetical protein